MNEPRRIRSFVRRQGRMTDGQRRAFELLWGRFGIELADDRPIDLAAAFGREAPLVVEIGFGDGTALAAMAAADPGRNFLGIEVHRPGVGHLLRLLEEREIGNVRVVSHDAVEVLERHLPDGVLDEVRLYFPDPWHKTRHHKRRIVQPPFAELIARKLRPGALFHLATDWEEYARWMMTVLERAAGFANVAGPGCFSPRPEWRPLTKFEARGQRLGHGVWDLLYRRR